MRYEYPSKPKQAILYMVSQSVEISCYLFFYLSQCASVLLIIIKRSDLGRFFLWTRFAAKSVEHKHVVCPLNSSNIYPFLICPNLALDDVGWP